MFETLYTTFRGMRLWGQSRWLRLTQHTLSASTFIVVAMVLLLLVGVGNALTKLPPNLRKYTKLIQERLNESEKEVFPLLKDRQLVRRLAHPNSGGADLARWAAKPYTFCIYDSHDSLVFWSSTRILPDSAHRTAVPRQTSTFYQAANGKYEVIRDTVHLRTVGDTASYTIVVLIPIFQEYPVENEYVSTGFAFRAQPIPRSIALVPDSVGENFICDLSCTSRYYLTRDLTRATPPYRWLVMFGYLGVLLLLGAGLQRGAIETKKHYGDWVAFVALVIVVLFLRNISILTNLSGELATLDLFNPNKFQHSVFTTSLGDLLINVSMLLWLALFFYREVRFVLPDIARTRFWVRMALVVGFYLSVIACIFGVDEVFKSVVLRSSITLDINQVLQLDGYSFLTFIAIAELLVAVFVFGRRVVSFVRGILTDTFYKGVFVVAAILLFTLLNFANAISLNTVLLLISSIVFIFVLDLFEASGRPSVTWVAIWLLLFALFASFLIYHYNGEKDVTSRRRLAEALATERDAEAESRLLAIERAILDDPNLQGILSPFFLSRKDLEDRLQQRYLSDNYLFQKYQISLHTYYADGQALEGETTPYDVFEFRINEKEAHVGTNLYFWNHKSVFYSYILKLPVREKNTTLGWMILECTPKPDRATEVFEDLLSSSSLRTVSLEDKYNFAIYDKNVLIRKRGNFYDELLNLTTLPKTGQAFIIREADRSNLVYRASENKVILVTRLYENIIQPFSLFSYLFFFFSILAALFWGGGYLASASRTPFSQLVSTVRPGLSLRNKIQYAVIAIIMLSFSIIAFVSIVYIRGNYTEYITNRVLRKTQTTLDREYSVASDSITKPDIDDIAQSHGTDVHIFDQAGRLVTSSEPTLFEKGLQARIMPLNVFWELLTGEKQEVTQPEQIGGFNYRMTYLPLKNRAGKRVGFLGLPYTGVDKQLENDLAGFVQTLLNIYVLLLLLSGAIAVFIANSVTRPLAVISEKLKSVRVGGANEPLEWNSRDEIGKLVEVYNQMILEVEQSVRLLAKSEREGAWREMARQVAHEIKNPLTPMKLNIQQIQRIYATDPDRAAQFLDRISVTLIEQIDNLANIANAFSDFAKMPQMQNEEFTLGEVLYNVYTLFCQNPDIDWSLDMAKHHYTVFTDKNQLVQVLNNIIKNAEQAMPDDRRGAIEILLYRRGGMAVVQISDNGTGIPPEQREKIFVPNFTTKSSGSGLGLAISKQIIEASQGNIYFESRVGAGTDFFIELPIIEREEEV